MGVLLVTYTSIRQRSPSSIKPFSRRMKFAPGVAVNTAEGPQPEMEDGGELLMIIPVGRLSSSLKFVRSVLLGAKISILSLELSPTEMVEGVNDFIPATVVPLTLTVAVSESKFSTP